MRSALTVAVLAFAAYAGIALSWGPVEGEYTELQIRADGAVLAVIEPGEDGFPEGYELKEAFFVIPGDCIGCQLCVGTGPVDAISMNDCGKAVIDPELCINCGICASNCPVSAIKPLSMGDCSLYGITLDDEEVLLQEGFEEE